MVRRGKEELLEALDRIAGAKILVAGDLMLDRYIWGEVERISYEAPVPVVHVTRTEDRLGGCGNVVQNLRGLGASVSVCGFVGDDAEAHIVLRLLDECGADREGVMTDGKRPTTIKTRVIARKQQIVRIDREDSSARASALQEGFAAVLDSQLDAMNGVIISDYGKGAVNAKLLSKLAEARAQNRIGLGVRPLMVDPSPANYGLYSGITVAKPNRKEAEAATGLRLDSQERVIEAAHILIDKWDAEMMLISLGSRGLALVKRKEDKALLLEALARDVFDVSGAGDTVVSIFTGALSAGVESSLAGDLANIGAGLVVSEVGTAAVKKAAMQHEIERLAAQSELP
jgi:D-beta-D-heptose 7-phosphate kinase/D-beta-D-heptose 1-phosphate adenosyltransferase